MSRSRILPSGALAAIPGATAAVLVVVAVTVALTSCSSSTVSVGLDTAPARTDFAASAVMTPPKTAPDFTLRDSLGHTVSLSQFRGRAVILTFIYAHCPNVCPVIVAKLHQALLELGPSAREVQMLGVSVDPHGDTPAYVNQFLAVHHVTGRFQYLLGSLHRLRPIWREYHIAVLPHPGTNVIGHAAVLYGISGSGKEMTVYSASTFQPQMIVHDVPLLAAR